MSIKYEDLTPQDKSIFLDWKNDWNLFAREVLDVDLDPEQQAILSAIQHNKMVAVASGTARGKDYVAAVAAMCFFYLSPVIDERGVLLENTKVALTAPTGRQVSNIMYPEIVRLYNRANSKLKEHGPLPGRLVSNDIRTDYAEWFLTGFKADDKATEAWTGFHAVHTMFIITEASGIAEETFAAIEGNLQADSKILIVFNPNNSIGYAARAMSSPRWVHFRLDSLTAPNVLLKRQKFPGQVDYEWIKDKVDTWCIHINEYDYNEGEGDFEFEGHFYRPNDLFRVKVRGMFPKVSEDVLIPYLWVEMAVERWKEWKATGGEHEHDVSRRIGVDIAGMGVDKTVFCHRFGNKVDRFDVYQSGGEANHMQYAGIIHNSLHAASNAEAFIDTIGEGAGVFSRCIEMGLESQIYSVKFSESAQDLSDITEQYEFANMRAYLFWAVRDWLNPAFDSEACIPPESALLQELVEVKYKVRSDGRIIIEPKEDIKARLGRSIDLFDALANTFYPASHERGVSNQDLASMIF